MFQQSVDVQRALFHAFIVTEADHLDASPASGSCRVSETSSTARRAPRRRDERGIGRQDVCGSRARAVGDDMNRPTHARADGTAAFGRA